MSKVDELNPTDRSIRESTALVEQAVDLVPGISQTGSKTPTQFVQGVSPTHIERAEGSHLWDADGNEYIECNASLGPIVLGHRYPDVTEAVIDQLNDGTVFTMEHPLHVEVAELLTEVVPSAEMVKFAKSGNDVTTLAAKVARAHTGRDVIATQGYHGWPDVWFAPKSGLNAGIPEPVAEFTEQFSYNDIESLEAIFEAHPDNVAAIVVNPANQQPPEDDFLERLREIADREGAVLVFDEVLTGFRLAIGGAQEYFGVTPDLTCLAKAMSNGFPLAALVGRRDVMETMNDGDFFYSMTYAGEAASLAAAKASITVQQNEPVHEHIARQGQRLMDGYNDLVADHGLDGITSASGLPARFVIGFSNDPENVTAADTELPEQQYLKSLFMQEAHKRGVLFTSGHIPTYSHSDEDVETMLSVYDTCLGILSESIESGTVESRLEGDPVGATLRQQTGEHD